MKERWRTIRIKDTTWREAKKQAATQGVPIYKFLACKLDEGEKEDNATRRKFDFKI